MLSIKQGNNKANDIKLVSLYSTIKMMHGPINIRFLNTFHCNDISTLLYSTATCDGLKEVLHNALVHYVILYARKNNILYIIQADRRLVLFHTNEIIRFLQRYHTHTHTHRKSTGLAPRSGPVQLPTQWLSGIFSSGKDI